MCRSTCPPRCCAMPAYSSVLLSRPLRGLRQSSTTSNRVARSVRVFKALRLSRASHNQTRSGPVGGLRACPHACSTASVMSVSADGRANHAPSGGEPARRHPTAPSRALPAARAAGTIAAEQSTEVAWQQAR